MGKSRSRQNMRLDSRTPMGQKGKVTEGSRTLLGKSHSCLYSLNWVSVSTLNMNNIEFRETGRKHKTTRPCTNYFDHDDFITFLYSQMTCWKTH